MADEVIEERSVQDGRGIELLPRDRRANHGKDARANHGPDAESGQRNRTKRPFEFTVRLLAIRDQLVDGLPGKKLVAQSIAPSGRNESTV
jgi:hypothetical protein